MTHAQKPSIDHEMHELNAEADFLEQKTIISPGSANGEDIKLQAHHSDPDAEAMVINSLRNQIQDLFSQVSQLNNKLVRSYDRVSDLEDELHVTSSNLRQATIKVGQLELERTQHLSALSTGLLVEKSHVTTELTRLMEKATEEAARRGQAESAREEIEKDLDDLSAGLFDQANRMVAEARIAEARSSRKVEETEAALRSAEEVVGALQAQMQSLQSDKEQADRRVEEMRMRMGKGKWVDFGSVEIRSTRHRLFASHAPYHEFLIFVSHLRAIHPASPQPPAMSTLTTLPFLARLIAEDADTTVRLDLAPSLNWLSRRSVIGAIHNGHLTIEPMQFTTLLEELAPPNIPASSHHTHIVCALCGMSIYSTGIDSSPSTPTTPNTARSGSQSASWSSTLFKNVRSSELNLPALTGQPHRHTSSFSSASSEPPTQVYVFRLDSTTSSGLPMSLPLSNQHSGSPARQAIYPLCTTGWCLARLRTTCSMWAFVRTNIVEKIWEEPPLPPLTSALPKPGINGALEKKHDGVNGTRKPTPPLQQPPQRLPKVGSTLGSLWGSMQRSLSGSATSLKSPDGASPKEQEKPKLPPRDPSRKTLPPPPPSHPTVSHSPKSSVSHAPASPVVHRVPPPLKEKEAPSPTVAAPVPVTPASAAVPPPLPKRSRGRERAATPEPSGDMKVAAEAAQPEAPPAEPQKEKLTETSTPNVAETTATVSEEPTKQEPSPAEEEAKVQDKKPILVIPEGPISQSTSMDSFMTPTEELRGDTTPSDAATSIPLPTSSELSPTKTPTGDQSPSVEVPTIDVAAPTPTTAVIDDKPQASPSRTDSPAPPPLPRRAAARARPSSVLVPQTEGEQPERNSIDVPTAGDTTVEKKVEEEPKESPLESPSDAPAPADPAAVADASTTITAEPESLLASDDPTATPTPEPAAATAPVEDLQERLEAALEASAPPEENEKVILVNGHAESAPAEPESVPDVPPPAYAAGDVRANVNGDKKEKDAVSVAESETANGLYVGDATWEERTYKELVRLREEMFWARIGAVVQ
ncbi:hypothetical protein V8D89_014711 [Ganoderma adspersum]